MSAGRPCIGRLAPSPTGLLHLGNAWSFFLAWLSARCEGGRIFLRMEDIDPDRSRQEWIDGIIRDLRWLGLDWDEFDAGASHGGCGRGDGGRGHATWAPGAEDAGETQGVRGVFSTGATQAGMAPQRQSAEGAESGGNSGDGQAGPFRQSERGAYYARMLGRLQVEGRIYPCFCTRKELRELAGAPHGAADGLGDAGAAYPGTCRNLSAQEREARLSAGRHASLRLRCPDGEAGRQRFCDLVLGPQSMTITQCGGDFVLRRSDGVWAYQLAVVCDDIAMGVTQVVRGEDILFSTPRQLFLYQCFGAQAPEHAHIPLLCDAGGERLAKRHKSLSLDALRQRGCRPERIIGWLAWRAGLQEEPEPAHPAGLAERLRSMGRFPWGRLPQSPVLVPGEMELLRAF